MYTRKLHDELLTREFEDIADNDPIWTDIESSISLINLIKKGYRCFKDRVRGIYYAEDAAGVHTDIGLDIDGHTVSFWGMSKFNLLHFF